MATFFFRNLTEYDPTLLGSTCINVQSKRFGEEGIALESILNTTNKYRRKHNLNELTEESVREYEVQILEIIEYEINTISLFDFVELLTGCVYDLSCPQVIPFVKEKFIAMASKLYDYLLFKPGFLSLQRDPCLFASTLIFLSSKIITSKRNEALLSWRK
ncbi:predicted protein [Naegleria gruberi]|uniref:Predicted protein n=1 Tax=Naegleria gruberi TaxID=5762 RepID=D2V4U6_NAEGR|nr:uncharacterized protein NAEGRDRAFT_63911 [Naegleria gruberi]EFC47994.1 predicted protein [Naegleria gruberi]|eukprot:XP_002680738.1 predicted protein [Naegleria gruberi strain NEG-M]